jgi:hypothetical protein
MAFTFAHTATTSELHAFSTSARKVTLFSYSDTPIHLYHKIGYLSSNKTKSQNKIFSTRMYNTVCRHFCFCSTRPQHLIYRGKCRQIHASLILSGLATNIIEINSSEFGLAGETNVSPFGLRMKRGKLRKPHKNFHHLYCSLITLVRPNLRG